MEMNQENASRSCPASDLFPPAHVSEIEEIEEVEETALEAITIPEPQVCRICRDEGDEDLVDLGCKCRGELSKMHKSCFMEWFAVRMFVQFNNYCEVCNSMLGLESQMVVEDAVADHEDSGRDVLIERLQSEIGTRRLGTRRLGSIINMERAASAVELLEIVQMEILQMSIARTAPTRLETAIDMERRVFRETTMELAEHDHHWHFVGVVGVGVLLGFAIICILAGVVLLIMGRR